MAYRGTYFTVADFSGGYCGNLPSTSLGLNQAADMDNLIIGPGGKSIRTPWPTIRANATEFGSADSYPVVGLGYLRTGSDTYYLAIKNTKAYGATAQVSVSRDNLTFTDRTGAVTITASGSAASALTLDRYSFCTFNSLLFGFGGPYNSPDAPFKWQGGANNIAALGGSPPSALYCFSANNRVFAYNTAADRQKIYWSILANGEDWTGDGSGNAVVGSLDDGDPVIAHAVLANNVVLLFKTKGIYQMNISSAPFPIFKLFDGIGTLCSTSVVVANGLAWFIDTNGRMHSTDGNTIQDYPDSAMNFFIYGNNNNYVNYLFNSAPFVYSTVNGYRVNRAEYDIIVWAWTSILGEGQFALAWDLRNKCWLRFSKGFNFPVAVETSVGVVGGNYNTGRLMYPEVLGYGTNDTDATTTVTSYWRTGWMSPATLAQAQVIRRAGLALATENQAGGGLDGSWTVDYGFNFLPDTQSFELSAPADYLEAQTFRFGFVKGIGIATQFKFSWTGSSQTNMAARVNGLLFAGKGGGQQRVNSA